jgi:EamA domain-containing membrane protein RarD
MSREDFRNYGEALTPGHMVTFGCIWVALAIFTTDQLRRSKT